MALMGESNTGPSPRIRKTRTITSNTVATITDDVLIADASGGSFTVTLPASSSHPADITVKKIDSTGNTVTILPTNPDTLDGRTNYILTGATMPSMTFMPNGTGWYVL